MNRRIEASRPLRGQPDVLHRRFRGDPAAWLPALTEPAGRPGHWQVYLWGGDVGVLVDLVLGLPADEGTTTWRRIRWKGGGRWSGRRVPSFDGDIGLQRDDRGATLVLCGMYRPPGGLLGLLADRVLLQRLAAATLHQFLADIADRLAPEPEPEAGAAPPERSRVSPD